MGGSKPTRAERQANKRLRQEQQHEAELAAEGNDVEAAATEKRRHWWGAPKRKVRASRLAPPRSAPGGGTWENPGAPVATPSEKPAAEPQSHALSATSSTAGPTTTDEGHGPEYDDADDVPLGQADEPYGRDRPHWNREPWEDLKVGDFVKLRADESVPADLVVCATSEEENVVYLETKNLDGETNLKSRHAVPELVGYRSANACAAARFTISTDAPDVNMYQFGASLEMHDGQVDEDGKPLRSAITLNTVLLRGCVVRNVDWVIGIVVATGRDSKIVLNSGGTPSKRSKVERQMNPLVCVEHFSRHD